MGVRDLFLTFEKRRFLNKEKKRKIACRALEFIHPEDEIFLGAGTTLSFLGEELGRSSRHFMLKIWTNNLFVTNLWLKKYEKVFTENFVGITAGEISRKNLSIVNLIAPFSHIRKALIGTPGLSFRGFSSDDMYTVQQMEFLIKRVQEVIVLADSSKIGRDCTYLTRSMRMVKLDIRNGKKYVLITDAGEGGDRTLHQVHVKLQEIGFQIVTV